MNTYYWGPRLWEVLHCITLDYPVKPTEEEKQNMRNFLVSLKSVLPCIYCRRNYERNLKENPIKLNCRKDLVLWLIDIHNEVNGKEGKRPYSYVEVLNLYEKKLGKNLKLTEDDRNVSLVCNKHCWNSVNISIIIFILLMIVYLMRQKLYS